MYRARCAFSLTSFTSDFVVASRLAEQDKWLHEQIDANKGEPYWEYMDALLQQFDGMVDGYQQASRDANSPNLPMLERQDFQFVINNGRQHFTISFDSAGSCMLLALYNT